jgi:hypothetical protein
MAEDKSEYICMADGRGQKRIHLHKNYEYDIHDSCGNWPRPFFASYSIQYFRVAVFHFATPHPIRRPSTKSFLEVKTNASGFPTIEPEFQIFAKNSKNQNFGAIIKSPDASAFTSRKDPVDKRSIGGGAAI